MDNERDGFKTKIGFIMAAAGSAVGLGNLWKFPYLTGYYGGGVFIFTYLIILLIVAVPIVLAETVLGVHTKKSAVPAFEEVAKEAGAKKWWGIVGFMGVLACVAMFAYYSVVGGWVAAYFAQSVTTGIATGDAASEAFNTLIATPITPIIWHLVFLGVTMIICLRGVAKGLEKVGNFMMPALFVMLVVVAIRSLTLDGAWEGVVWMFKPDFSKFSSEMLVAALGQVFFSMSLGTGVVVAYGSYLKGKQNIAKASIQVALVDTGVAMLAGLAILPAVFAFGFEPGQGVGLLFVTIPSIFAEFGTIAGPIFTAIFFLLALFAAFTTSIAMMEIPSVFLMDKLGWSRKKSIIVITALIAVLGSIASLSYGIWGGFTMFGLNFFDFMDAISAKVLMPVVGLLTVVFVGYIWKPEKARDIITAGGEYKFAWYGFWKICIKYLIPVLIILIFLSGFGIIG
ncbi:MAG: sodium-dependent transporter [Bacillota bacterium]